MSQNRQPQHPERHPSLRPLTDRQHAVLTLIRVSIRTRGVPPTRSELAGYLDLRATASVETHLTALARKGYIELLPDIQRGIKLLIPDEVPLLDTVYTCPVDEPLVTDSRITSTVPASFAAGFDPYPTFFMTLGSNAPNFGLLRAGAVAAVHTVPDAGSLLDEHNIHVLRLADEVVCRQVRRLRSNRLELRSKATDGRLRKEHLDVSKVRFEGAVIGMHIGAPTSWATEMLDLGGQP